MSYLYDTALGPKSTLAPPLSLTEVSDYAAKGVIDVRVVTIEYTGEEVQLPAFERPPTLKLIGPGPTVPPGRIGKIALVCDKCGAESGKTFKANMAHEAIARFLRPQGWEIHNDLKHAVCPRCMRREPDMQQSKEAIRQQHHAGELIEKYFDPERGAFAPGWDDRRIATETGLSLDAAEAIREALGGPIKVDPMVSEALAEVADIRAVLEREMAEMHALFNTTTSGLLQRLSKVEAQLTGANKRLRAVS